MRFLTGMLVAACLWAQGPAERERTEAQARVDDLRRKVEEGVLPRATLEKAEAALADAGDAVLLQETLYGAELTEDRLDEMLVAARRRLGRRQADLDAAKRLVEEGGAPRLSLTPVLEKFDYARREVDLAESRAKLVQELSEMARAELAVETEEPSAFDRFDGRDGISERQLRAIEAAFELRFARPLPVSARGETAVHRSLGFDHRERVDVALHPDDPQGVWLRQYLMDASIPFYAFRHAVRGKSTGAHIHIGPASNRIARVAKGG